MGQSKRFTESWRLGRLNSARKTYSTPPVLPRWRLESHSLLHPCLLQSGQLSCHRCWTNPGRVEVGRGLCMLGGLARGRRGNGVAFCDRLLASKTKKVRCGKISMHVRQALHLSRCSARSDDVFMCPSSHLHMKTRRTSRRERWQFIQCEAGSMQALEVARIEEVYRLMKRCRALQDWLRRFFFRFIRVMRLSFRPARRGLPCNALRRCSCVADARRSDEAF